MKKFLSIIIVIAIVLSLFIGCKNEDSSSESKPTNTTTNTTSSENEDKQEEEKLVIGSVIMNTSGEWFAEVMKGMEAAGKDLDVEVKIVSSDNEVSKEFDNVSMFIAQDVDALCISPLSADASVAAIEDAKSAKIPVINWNTSVNTETNGFVGVSNYDLGAMTGEYVAQYIKDNFPDGAKLALLTNSSYEVGVERCNGFRDKVKDLENVEIVAEQDAEMQDEGLDITEQILTANPDVDLIWAWNMTSLLGCVAAIENMGNKDIVIMGTDMSVDLARDMLSDSVKLQAITTQMPYEIGYKAVENAVKAIKGEEYDKQTLVPLKTYTKDNVAEIEEYIETHKDLVE